MPGRASTQMSSRASSQVSTGTPPRSGTANAWGKTDLLVIFQTHADSASLPHCAAQCRGLRCHVRRMNGAFLEKPPHSLCKHSTRLHVSLCIDRKSTRLNSSHLVISYAVFCLNKKRMS